MFDQRLNDVAVQLLDYSIDVKEGEIVRVIATDFAAKPLVKELVKELTKRKAIADVTISDSEVQALEGLNSTEKGRAYKSKHELAKTHDMDAIVFIRCVSNNYDMAQVPQETMAAIIGSNKEAQNIRVNERKWVLLNYPTQYSANAAKMPLDKYEDFYFNVMLVDYKKMNEDAQALKDLMDKTKKVRITGPGTDLTFEIVGGSTICAGLRNVPDGEVYTSPIKESMNGTIQYNTITSQQNIEFNNVRFTVKDGKIIEAHSDTNNDLINKVLDSDEGARYFGEFAIGFNPAIDEPVGDILFDEKIYGSFHLTPGQSYKNEGYNGNDSIIHWDLVCIQKPDFGGGEIYFDDVLIRKDGEFVVDSLKGLNR